MKENELAELKRKAAKYGYVLRYPTSKKKEYILPFLIKLFVGLDKIIDSIITYRWERAIKRAASND